tara:strand:- start:537 stop:1403 length:867 start_codon:yes stop_codon:yes gene_type:complete
MPELPEVEVVKRSLRKNIVNSVITNVLTNTNKLRYAIKKKDFQKLKNHKIISITRRSKYLLINTNNELTILVHLGMTGKFIIIDGNSKFKKTSFYYSLNKNDKKHNHVIFNLNKDKKLIYNDIRKFGFIKILCSKNIYKSSHLSSLGPEPMSNNFNSNYFKNIITNKNRTTKDILMDQKIVSGLGNIYVNEILFLSKINPRKKIKKLKDKDIEKIVYFTKKILKRSILEGGSSIKNFSNSDGKNGIFQQQFNVYGQIGEKCIRKNCKNYIRKTYISNRSTFFCKTCQK